MQKALMIYEIIIFFFVCVVWEGNENKLLTLDADKE